MELMELNGFFVLRGDLYSTPDDFGGALKCFGSRRAQKRFFLGLCNNAEVFGVPLLCLSFFS